MIDKSKIKESLPNLQEITQMTSKLVADVKKSVDEIYQDYKSKRIKDEAKEADTKDSNHMSDNG